MTQIPSTLSQVKGRFREFFLLENRERLAVAMPDAQRDAVRMYEDAAKRRFDVARDVRGPKQTSVALELYRQGALLRALAFLIFKDGSLDASSIPPSNIVDKLVSTLDRDAPPEFARVRPMLSSSDPLEPDRLVPEEAERRAQDFEVTARWLGGLFDALSPRELRLRRVARIAIAAALVVTMLAMLVARIVAPKNLALGRPATCSGSTMGGTLPSGAVDGSHSGPYEFHSAPEESPWLAIDLGTPYLITRAKIYGRRDPPYDQSLPLAFEVSDDGTNYRQVALRTEGFAYDSPWVLDLPAVASRFVRLKTLRHSYLVVNEVEIFGKKPK